MTLPPQPLLIVGLAAWCGAVLGWAGHATGVPLPVQATVVLVPVLIGAAVRPAGRPAAVAILLLLGVLAGWAAASSHLAISRPPIISQWVAAGAQIEVHGTVASAQVVHSASGRSYARAVVDIASIGPPGQQRRLDGSTVLIGDPGTLGTPDRGTGLVVRGRLLPVRKWREPGLGVTVSRVVATSAPTGFASGVARAREQMWQSLRGTDPPAASLVAGLAIGDDSRQSPELGEAMRVSGLSHLTAVSGGNIAILAGLVLGAAAAVGAGLRVRILLAVVAVVGYAGFVGPEPSVLRASVMGAVAVVGLMRTTRSGGFPLLGLAVLVLIAVRPGLALSWGFALSVAATAGILAAAGRIEAALAARLPRAPATALMAVSVTVAAQAATAPLLAAMTGTLSLVGLPANLLAAPLVAPITVLGLLLVATATVAPPLAGIVAHLVEPFGMLLARIAVWAAAVPWAVLEVPAGWAGAAVVGGVLAACAAALVGLSRGPPGRPG